MNNFALMLAEATEKQKNNSWWIYIVLIVLVVVMLVLPMFTNRKRAKEYNQMVEKLRVGDEVRTIGGIIGRVVKISKKGEFATFVLETGNKGTKTTMEFDMNAIGTVLTSTYVEEEKKEEKQEQKDSAKEEKKDEPEKAEENAQEAETQEQPKEEKTDYKEIEKQISGKKSKKK